MLQTVADSVTSNQVFVQLYGNRQPSLSTISEGFNSALSAISDKPELLATNPHESLGAFSCDQCVTDGPYRLTPLSQA